MKGEISQNGVVIEKDGKPRALAPLYTYARERRKRKETEDWIEENSSQGSILGVGRLVVPYKTGKNGKNMAR